MDNRNKIITILFFSKQIVFGYSAFAQFPNATLAKYTTNNCQYGNVNKNFKNKLKQIREYKFDEQRKDSILTKKWEFNRMGNQIEDISYSSDGQESRIFINKWNNDLLQNIYELNIHNKLDTISKVFYVYNFPIIIMYDQTQINKPSKTVYFYDNQDSLLRKEERYNEANDSTKLTFEINNYYFQDSIKSISHDYGKFIIATIQKPIDNYNVISYDLDKENNCNFFIKKKYDDGGNCTSEIIDVEGKYSLIKYFYDDNNLLKVKIVMDDEGKEIYIYKYSYW